MEVQIISVSYNGQDKVVKVGFYESVDGELQQRHIKTYYLKIDQKVEELYPAFKDDLEDFEKGMAEVAKDQELVEKSVDLSKVESARVISHRKFEEKAKQEQAEREAKQKELASEVEDNA